MAYSGALVMILRAAPGRIPEACVAVAGARIELAPVRTIADVAPGCGLGNRDVPHVGPSAGLGISSLSDAESSVEIANELSRAPARGRRGGQTAEHYRDRCWCMMSAHSRGRLADRPPSESTA